MNNDIGIKETVEEMRNVGSQLTRDYLLRMIED